MRVSQTYFLRWILSSQSFFTINYAENRGLRWDWEREGWGGDGGWREWGAGVDVCYDTYTQHIEWKKPWGNFTTLSFFVSHTRFKNFKTSNEEKISTVKSSITAIIHHHQTPLQHILSTSHIESLKNGVHTTNNFSSVEPPIFNPALNSASFSPVIATYDWDNDLISYNRA